MGNLSFVIKREFKIFRENKIMKTLLLGGPILYGLLFGAVYSNGKIDDQPIVVVDQDQSPLSDKLKDMLEDNEALTVKYVLQENTDLERLFRQEGIQGAVVIPDSFERDVLLGRTPEVNSYINNANLVSSGYVNRNIFAVVATLNAITSAKTGRPAPAVQLNVFRLFNPASNYMTFVWPSYLFVILQSVVLVVVALSFASENENNTFGELAQLRASSFTIALGKLTVYWASAIFGLLVYALYFLIMRQKLPTHVFDTLVIAGLFIVSVSFQGMIAGLLIKSQLKVIQLLMILIMPAYITSGFSWPSMYDAWPAQLYGWLFPYLPFVNGLRILLLENGTLADIPDFVSLQSAQLATYFIIAILIFYIKRKKSTGKQVSILVM